MSNESLLALHYAQMAQEIEDDQAKISKDDFDLVVDCTHWSGKRRHKLSDEDMFRVWTTANGFGKVTIEYIAEKLEWDWSHIRDSDSTAIAAIATYLREQGCDRL